MSKKETREKNSIRHPIKFKKFKKLKKAAGR
jgi:hypothetical protein